MIKLKGKYGEAIVHSTAPLDTALKEIQELLDAAESIQGNKLRIMPDYHAGKGCVIGTTMKLNGERIIPSLVGVDIGCLDKDTEFLTPYGWKKISEYQNDDKVLQYNKETDSANFVNPMNYIVEDCDEFLHFKNNKGLDQMLSSEHKVLVWKGYKSKGYSLEDFRADDLSDLGSKLDKGYYGVKTSFNILNDGIDLTENEIRLDVMISADGSIKYQREKEHQIYLHFKKERKIVRAKELLENNGIEYKETLGKDGSTHIYFFINKKFNKDLSKYWGASKEQLKTLAEESLLWDGHLGYRSFFSSTDKSDADIIQFAFASTDIRAGITEVEYEGKNWKKSYIVTPTKNNIVGITNTVSTVKSVDGKKYCFTVPTGYFIARRNGKMFITGNCGVYVAKLKCKITNLEELDNVIKENILTTNSPQSTNVRNYADSLMLKDLKLRTKMPIDNLINKGALQLGTLGGGNHFIELAEDEQYNDYILVHTGSRGVGASLANYYISLAGKNQNQHESEEIIKELKAKGEHQKIEAALKQWHKENPKTPKLLAALNKTETQNYLHDVNIIQQYAVKNREAIVETICEKLSLELDKDECFHTIHNYIDTEDLVLRKGAVRANKGEKLIIPLNMRDGSLICIGKGNEDWNNSAPHGAGRVLSRTKAHELINVADFKQAMSAVYSTTVNENTVDESPFAYKSASYIMEEIKPTVDIVSKLTPVYNFKDDGTSFIFPPLFAKQVIESENLQQEMLSLEINIYDFMEYNFVESAQNLTANNLVTIEQLLKWREKPYSKSQKLSLREILEEGLVNIEADYADSIIPKSLVLAVAGYTNAYNKSKILHELLKNKKNEGLCE